MFIQYYQELLNECIDIQEHLEELKNQKEIMKGVNQNGSERNLTKN